MDTTAFGDAVLNLPDALRAAATAAQAVIGLPDTETVASVLIVPCGYSVVDAEMATAIASEVASVPIVVARGAEVPSWVDDSTLVMVTGGVLGNSDARDAIEQARDAGATTVVVAIAGELTAEARKLGAVVVEVAQSATARPLPGPLAVAMLCVLDQCGQYPGSAEWIDAAVTQVRHRLQSLDSPTGLTTKLARRIGRTFPVMYAGSDLGAAAARAWKSAINLGAKLPAYANAAPELNYGELAGFGQSGDVTRQVFTLILLRHDYEHPTVADQFAHLPDLLDEIYASLQFVNAQGNGQLAQLCDLVAVGLHLSVELARIARVDPGPVPIVTELDQAVEAL